jgi:hypothetical protein
MKVLRISFLSSFTLELLATLSVAVVAVEVGLRLIEGGITLQAALFVLVLAPEAYLPLRQVGVHYHASQAGVPIDIVARGICSLRPGVPGLSETIRVRSIVDRFLEHSRVYVFGPDDDAQVYLSSADWMPRNFFRRVELMFPVLAPALATRILKEILPVYLADNTRARQLDSDGVFNLLHPGPGETPVRCQIQMLEQSGAEVDAFGSAVSVAAGGEATGSAIGATGGGRRGRVSAGRSRKSRS